MVKQKKKKFKPITKKCERCGKEFIITNPKSRQKYCSKENNPECHRKRVNKAVLIRYHKKKKKIKKRWLGMEETCQYCGSTFKITQSSQKYCTETQNQECYHKRMKETKNKTNRIIRTNILCQPKYQTKGEKNCEWCGKPIIYSRSIQHQRFHTFCENEECWLSRMDKSARKSIWKKRQLGTYNLGSGNIRGHRNIDFEKEKKIVRNEVIYNILNRRIHGERIKFRPGAVEFSVDDWNDTIQFLEVYSVQDIPRVRKCVECGSSSLLFDEKRFEISCQSCGLVLSHPISYVGGQSVKIPGYDVDKEE